MQPEPALEAEALQRSDLDSAAVLTEPTLAAWNVPFEHFRGDGDLPLVARQWERAYRQERPVALLLHRGFA